MASPLTAPPLFDFGLQTVPQSNNNTVQEVEDDGFPFPVSSGLGISVLNSDVEVVLFVQEHQDHKSQDTAHRFHYTDHSK